MSSFYLFITITLLIYVFGCDNDQVIYAYIVAKPTQEQSKVNEWQPVLRVTYRVGDTKVISEVAGLLDEFKNCNISNKKNWECQYQDGRGINRFGFKNGKFWEDPGWGDRIKHVTRWEYNMIRCKWYQTFEGKFKGIASCLKTYI